MSEHLFQSKLIVHKIASGHDSIIDSSSTWNLRKKCWTQRVVQPLVWKRRVPQERMVDLCLDAVLWPINQVIAKNANSCVNPAQNIQCHTVQYLVKLVFFVTYLNYYFFQTFFCCSLHSLYIFVFDSSEKQTKKFLWSQNSSSRNICISQYINIKFSIFETETN